MRRGTTPTLTFELPFHCGLITALNIAFAQEEEVVLEKGLDDCVVNENTLEVTLTEDDTLALDCKKRYVEIQLRVGCGKTKKASNIIKTPVDRILKDGCLE